MPGLRGVGSLAFISRSLAQQSQDLHTCVSEMKVVSFNRKGSGRDLYMTIIWHVHQLVQCLKFLTGLALSPIRTRSAARKRKRSQSNRAARAAVRRSPLIQQHQCLQLQNAPLARIFWWESVAPKSSAPPTTQTEPRATPSCACCTCAMEYKDLRMTSN